MDSWYTTVRICSKWTYCKNWPTLKFIYTDLEWKLNNFVYNYNIVFFVFKCYSYFKSARALYIITIKCNIVLLVQQWIGTKIHKIDCYQTSTQMLSMSEQYDLTPIDKQKPLNCLTFIQEVNCTRIELQLIWATYFYFMTLFVQCRREKY